MKNMMYLYEQFLAVHSREYLYVLSQFSGNNLSSKVCSFEIIISVKLLLMDIRNNSLDALPPNDIGTHGNPLKIFGSRELMGKEQLFAQCPFLIGFSFSHLSNLN